MADRGFLGRVPATLLPGASRLPPILYGTAWKEEHTRELVELAILAGFRGIDTANQRKHYFEEGVGHAIQALVSKGLVHRHELFLQTKFTFRDGQDERLPYDPKASIRDQVRQSFESSLGHLQTNYLDSLLLHGPSSRVGLAAEDWEAWRALESLVHENRVHRIGICNVSGAQLQELVRGAKVKPSFVQNRCYASNGWDQLVRWVCHDHGIRYQAFSLLTANPHVVQGNARKIAEQVGKTPAQVVFQFATQVGMIPLTGTTSAQHMKDDLEVGRFALSGDWVTVLETST